jgi:uncharacterized protein YceK
MHKFKMQGLSMRTLLSSIFVLLLASGCSGIHNIQIPSSQTNGEWVSEAKSEANATTATSNTVHKRMYVRKKEARYVIKDEPYSIASKKKDPELLGPQRTYTADATDTVSRVKKTRKKSIGMTKESCISLIGEAKYNKYVQRYGGEAGAIRRCLVLKRLRG